MVSVEFPPPAPGVTEAGVKVALASAGRFDTVSATALVNGLLASADASWMV